MKPIPNWRDAHKFLTVQIAVFWGLVSAAFYLLPVIQEFVGTGVYVLLTITICIALPLARITHQPGLD